MRIKRVKEIILELFDSRIAWLEHDWDEDFNTKEIKEMHKALKMFNNHKLVKKTKNKPKEK